MYKTVLSFTCEVQQQFNGFQIQFPIPCKTKKVYLKAYYDDQNQQSLQEPPQIVMTPSNSEQKLFEFSLFNLESCKISPLNNQNMSFVVKEPNNQKRVFFITKGLKENLELFRNEAAKLYKKRNQSGKSQPQQQQNQNKPLNAQQIQVQNRNNNNIIISNNRGASFKNNNNINNNVSPISQQLGARKRPMDRFQGGVRDAIESKILSKQLKQKAQIDQNLKKSLPQGYFKKIPDSVLTYILQFLTKKEVFQTRIVCSDFETLAFSVIKEIKFPHEGDIPRELVVSILNKARYVKSLTFGIFKNYSQMLFQEKIVTSHKDLNFLDFSHFNGLTNKIVRRFLEKSPQISTLIIPYFSKISDDCLSVCQFYLKELKVLKFKSYQRCMNRNCNITDNCILQMLNLNKKLESLNMVSCQERFFEKLPDFVERNADISLRLQILKINNLHFQEKQQVDFLVNIKLFVNLKVLKLKNILTQTKEGFYNQENVPNDILRNIGINCKQIHSITFGDWATNVHIQIAAQFWKQNIIKLNICGPNISDSGVKEITESCENLKILKLRDCTKIQGSCFENIVSKKLSRVTINLSDYEWKLLQDIIVQKGLNLQAFRNQTRRY